MGLVNKINKNFARYKAERMECNGMNGAASGVMGGSKKVLPGSRTVATYVEEGTSLRSTQGVGVCFCTKNHDNPEAHSTSQASYTNQQPVDLGWLKRMKGVKTQPSWKLAG